MKPCNALSTHYSAYIDGELTPLESVAIRRHLSRCLVCRKEVQALENMKLSIHMHGHDMAPTTDLREKLTWAVSQLEAQQKRKIFTSLAMGVLAAAIIVVVASPQMLQTSDQVVREPMEETVSIVPISPRSDGPRAKPPVHAASVLDSRILSELVKRHQVALDGSTKTHPAIVSFEPLPVRFVDEGSQVTRVLNASYQRCLQTQPGASLAVLDSAQVRLPVHLQARLDATGVYVEQWENIEVRVSQSNHKIFVLLTNKAPSWNSPI
jgi:hypothetical protein